MVDELIDGNPGRYLETDAAGGRKVIQADALCINGIGADSGRYWLRDAKLEDCAKELTTLVIRLDVAEKTLDALIEAAEVRTDRVLGIWIK